jgi:polo-like kinase 1
LGAGGFGSCYKVIKVSEHKEEFACKIIKKASLKTDDKKEKLQFEITLQKSLDHPNIVRLEAFFEDDENVYILMELCPF